MASGDDRRGRDSRTGHRRSRNPQHPSQQPEHYHEPQQQGFMQAAGPPPQFSGQQYPQYGYYTQNTHSSLQQPPGGVDTNVPRASLPPPFSQEMPGIMYNVAQSSSSQQYGFYAPTGGPSRPHAGMPGPAVSQPSYYASTGIGHQAGGTGMAPQGGSMDQNQYFPTPSSYTPVSQSMAPPPFSRQGIPSFSPQSTTSESSPASSPLSPLLAPYHRMIRHTLQCLTAGRLPDAAAGLLEMSYELLRNVETFGSVLFKDIRVLTESLMDDKDLVFDDVTKRTARLRLWRNFNNTWLGVLTRQKDASDEILDAAICGTSAEAPQIELIPTEVLQRLGDELIPLCNGIDEWGLVDYEMGVWEEQIIDILDPCREVSKDITRVRSGRAPLTKRRSSAAARGQASLESQPGTSHRPTVSPPPPPGIGRRK